jgi:hypothetical protein
MTCFKKIAKRILKFIDAGRILGDMIGKIKTSAGKYK